MSWLLTLPVFHYHFVSDVLAINDLSSLSSPFCPRCPGYQPFQSFVNYYCVLDVLAIDPSSLSLLFSPRCPGYWYLQPSITIFILDVQLWPLQPFIIVTVVSKLTVVTDCLASVFLCHSVLDVYSTWYSSICGHLMEDHITSDNSFSDATSFRWRWICAPDSWTQAEADLLVS